MLTNRSFATDFQWSIRKPRSATKLYSLWHICHHCGKIFITTGSREICDIYGRWGMWLIRCFHCFEGRIGGGFHWLLSHSGSPSGKMAKWKTFNTFTMTGFPLDQIVHTHTDAHMHTHTQTTRTCQRALPADELGHFSFPWLRGIRFVLMEHRHILPKLWRDNSFPILYLSL